MNKTMDKLVLPTPLNGYILVAPIIESAGNMILSDDANKKPQRGIVIAIAKALDISDMGTVYRCPVIKGDTVFYRNWGSELFNYQGEDYVLVRFRDIIARI